MNKIKPIYLIVGIIALILITQNSEKKTSSASCAPCPYEWDYENVKCFDEGGCGRFYVYDSNGTKTETQKCPKTGMTSCINNDEVICVQLSEYGSNGGWIYSGAGCGCEDYKGLEDDCKAKESCSWVSDKSNCVSKSSSSTCAFYEKSKDGVCSINWLIIGLGFGALLIMAMMFKKRR